MTIDKKRQLAVFLVWLFTVSGIVGIIIGYSDFFLPLTPVNLLVSFVLLLWMVNFDPKTLLALLVPFSFGMITEYLGVNYGYIFGSYSYGANLGPKVGGVPWMIGINWALLTFITASFVRKSKWHISLKASIAAGIMVLFDVLLEQLAPAFDFWEFTGGEAPLQNYVGWFGVALVVHLIYQKLDHRVDVTVSKNVLRAMSVFFGFFIIYHKFLGYAI